MRHGAPNPAPAPVERRSLELIAAQAARINSQVKEINTLWAEVKRRREKEADDNKQAAERSSKYGQLKLEAQLGLCKVVIIAIAVVFAIEIVASLFAALMWFRHKELTELVKAARAPAPVASAPMAAGSSAPAATQVSPDKPR